MKILVVNGPNINMLGIREKELYGTKTYDDLVRYIEMVCAVNDITVEIYQSNSEGDIVTKIQQAYGTADGIVINPAAYTHTSIAILDALKAVALPAVEVHLTDIYEREEFRQVSYTSLACQKCFFGFGFEGYKKALEFLKKELKH